MGSISSTMKKHPNAGNKNQQQTNSLFDRLPDDVIRIIINKIQDARILIRCLTLNKRFASIVSQTDAILLPLHVSPPPPQNSSNNNDNNNDNNNNDTNLTRGNPENMLRSVVDYIITKLLRRNKRRDNQRRCRHFAYNRYLMTDDLYQCPPQIFQTFRHITELNLEIHSGHGAVDDVFLKWKASYGRVLKTCVIICAKSFRRLAIDELQHEEADLEDGVPLPPPSMPNYEFNSRIMWTMACLVTATARHFLLKHVMAEFPTVKKVRVTDAIRQGKLCMVEDDIRELRESMKKKGAMALVGRRAPNMRLRMCYEPVLYLPESRCEMEGATLVVISPASSKGELLPPPEMYGLDGGYDGDAAEKAVFAEAEREILNIKKRSTYVMEMASFSLVD